MTIQAANGRNLSRWNQSAPHILRDVTGNFAVETVWRLALQDRPAIGGLLIWKNRKDYLRLERIGERVRALCSSDRATWYTVGQVEFAVDDPLQVGLFAGGAIDRTIYHGAFPEGAAVRFESFQLWSGDA